MPTGFLVPLPPRVAADATVVAHAATEAIAAADFGKIHTNTGVDALEAIVLTLPAASAVAGLPIKVQLTAAEQVSLSPAADDGVYLGGNGVDNKDLVIAGVIGNYVDLYSDGERYQVVDYSGVLTKEA